MHRRTFVLLSALATAGVVSPAQAKRIRTVLVSTSRVRLGQIMPKLEEPLSEIDLGPAPAPNGSRIITRKYIQEALEDEGVQGVSGIPRSVRVKRKMQRLAAKQIKSLTEAAIAERGLKKGITITKIRPPARIKVAAGWDAVRVQLPRSPRRKGKWATTVMLSFEADGERVARVAVRVIFHLTEAATRPDIAKGAPLRLTVESGRVRVTIKAHAGADADVGDTFPVQLRPSGRIVRAKLVTPNQAVAVGGGK